MSETKVFLIYFSPTGGTQTTLRNIAKGIIHKLETYSLIEYDLTLPSSRQKKYHFSPKDLVVLGLPTYMGRLPKNNPDFFSTLKANKTPAAIIVTYGNREYEDALLEALENSKSTGFSPLSAAAFINSHSFSQKLSSNRPDLKDKKQMKLFGKYTAAKFMKGINEGIKVSGNSPYRTNTSIGKPLIPLLNENKCIKCKICLENCPTAALSFTENEEELLCDATLCISCSRCVHNCPVQARYFDPLIFGSLLNRLKPLCEKRKEPESFFN